ncbi:hypothetical protein [Spiroplasma chinense]|nr:hypothetical protein [Spiroplasma chinense]
MLIISGGYDLAILISAIGTSLVIYIIYVMNGYIFVKSLVNLMGELSNKDYWEKRRKSLLWTTYIPYIGLFRIIRFYRAMKKQFGNEGFEFKGDGFVQQNGFVDPETGEFFF